MPLDTHPLSGVNLNQDLTLRPGEDYNAGLYLGSAPVTTLTDPDGTPTLFVSADAFMALQAERDVYRQTLGLVAAWMVRPDHDLDHLAHLLGSAGFDRAQGEAMLSIINGVRGDRARRDTRAQASAETDPS